MSNKPYYGFPKHDFEKSRKSSIEQSHLKTCPHCGHTFSYPITMNCSHCGHLIISTTVYRKHTKYTGKLFKEDKTD